MRLNVLSVFLAFLIYSIKGDINSQCLLCFQNSNYFKYCMLSMDSAVGKCCLSNSTDGCLNDQFYCSNKVTTSFSYHKYAFCSFDPLVCGSPTRNLRVREVAQTISTSIIMSESDVCPYVIVTDSTLPFNTKVKITVDSAINNEVYLLTGSSLDSLTTQEKLSSGSSTTFEASKIGVLIVKGSYQNPYVTFTYQNEQIVSNAGLIGIVIGSSVGYFLILIAALIFLTRYLTKRRLKQMQSPNIVYFLKKKIIQYTQVKQSDALYHNKQEDPYKDKFRPVSPKYKNVIPPIDIGLNDNYMGQTDQITRMDSAMGDFKGPGSTQFPRVKPIAEEYGNTEKPKVNIRPYKFDIE